MRLTLDVTDAKGVLACIANEIAAAGGNIISVATFQSPAAAKRIIYVKVTGASKEQILERLTCAGAKVLDAHEISEAGYMPRIVDERARPFEAVLARPCRSRYRAGLNASPARVNLSVRRLHTLLSGRRLGWASVLTPRAGDRIIWLMKRVVIIGAGLGGLRWPCGCGGPVSA